MLGLMTFVEFVNIILGKVAQKVAIIFIKHLGRATQELTYKMITEKQKSIKLDK